MDGEDLNKAGEEMRSNSANDMSYTDVVRPINNQIINEKKRERSLFTRAMVRLGFMQNPQDPTINGATVILGLVVALFSIYYLINWAVGKLDEKDLERGNTAIMYSTATKANTRANTEAAKRAKLLEFIKQKNLYSEVPEELKVFESAEVENTTLEQQKQKEK